MRIGIFDLLAEHVNGVIPWLGRLLIYKQYASTTPQIVSAWCRQMGHQVFYATYYGVGDPLDRLPNDLDIIFMSVHTCMAPLAYALSKVYRQRGALTVLGGPHAKSFPVDSQRYFDIVVLECSRELVAHILAGEFDPHSLVTSQTPFHEVPTIAERLPEIRKAAFFAGRPHPGSFVPMLASLGCPYSCNFCVDWNNPYRPLSLDRLAEDVRFAARHLPGVTLAFYDPNFAVRFDETLAVFENIPPEQRSPYAIESSLTVLRPERLSRLRDTRCIAVTPGVESWTQYSNKAGVGSATNGRKLAQVIEHFHTLNEYIPYLGVNFLLGLDSDEGDEPFELTKEFIRRVPFAWPSINIPIAFGGTPLYDHHLRAGRILQSMPFNFYTLPYLTLRLEHYDPLQYFEKVLDVYTLVASSEMLQRRLDSSRHWWSSVMHYVRTFTAVQRRDTFRAMLLRLQNDADFLAFHRGQTNRLPNFYAAAYRQHLGKYIELMPLAESHPLLHDSAAVAPLVA